MLRGHAAPGDVVERHRIEHALVIHPIDEDHRDAARQLPREPLAVFAERRDQRTFDLYALEEPEVLALLLLVIVAVADEDAHAVPAASSAPLTRSAKKGFVMLMTVMPSSPLRPMRSCCAACSGT